MLCMSIKPTDNECDDSDGSEEFYSPSSSPQNTPEHSLYLKNPNSFQVLLMGNENSPKCLPHVVHIDTLTEGVNLIILIELGTPVISTGLYEAFLYLTIVQNIQMQRDVETLRPAFENLDIAIKKTNDGLKKNKNSAIECCQKKMCAKWDFIRKKYQEFVKNGDSDCILRAESSTISLLDIFKELLILTCFDTTILHSSANKIKEIVKHVDNKLSNFSDFLKVKALKNLSLGQYPFFYICVYDIYVFTILFSDKTHASISLYLSLSLLLYLRMYVFESIMLVGFVEFFTHVLCLVARLFVLNSIVLELP